MIFGEKVMILVEWIEMRMKIVYNSICLLERKKVKNQMDMRKRG